MSKKVLEDKPCAYCGKVFLPVEGHQKYCSEECHKQADRKLEAERRLHANEPPEERVCAFCGAKFTSRRSNRIYCSVRCNDKANQARKRSKFEWKTERHCKMCSRPFIPKIPAQEFCTDKCKYTWHNGKKKLFFKVCVGCGKEYSTKSADQKYCSISCAVKHSVPTTTLTCVDCGKQFSHTGRSHSSRCPECNKTYWSIWCVQHYYEVGKDKKYFSAVFSKPVEKRFEYRRICYAIWPRKCVVCGEDYIGKRFQLDVHHIDGDPSNDQPENLVPLCRTCHRRLHIRSQKNNLPLRQVLLEMWPSASQEIGAAVQRWTASHTANSVDAKPENRQANTELSNDMESVETVHGASHVDEESVQTTTDKSGQ